MLSIAIDVDSSFVRQSELKEQSLEDTIITNIFGGFATALMLNRSNTQQLGLFLNWKNSGEKKQKYVMTANYRCLLCQQPRSQSRLGSSRI